MDSSPVCLDDFEEHAVRVLAQGPLGYFQTGADDEITLRENRRAFTRWKILPRVLRDVSSCDLSTTILGHRISFPVCVAPTGYQGDAHPDGEIATAQAAFEMNTCYTMSTMSSKSIEDVSSAAPAGLRFFQLYIFKQRDITKQLIRRAEKAGFNALVVTVDVPFLAKRRKDIRSKYTPSPQARWVLCMPRGQAPGAQKIQHGTYVIENHT
ncbi:hypothetical protein CAPTEDRAFT_103996 [Capitella teleta]|uniref:FMN hydroxy acid dehydrogenase domain-containing protein n=1 Tax=Capitella teleta TaxID=283909 RepID=R7VKA7_CAPTE|nr:hypothetical protein CAPTEDRAFT_103996 [Capitella teleta]|eukprot:ELU17171.1 hypothetical protein CAPTEDRAFT_103996 [Capitella teleta]